MAQPSAPFQEDWFDQIVNVNWGVHAYIVCFIQITSIYNQTRLTEPSYTIGGGSMPPLAAFAPKLFADTPIGGTDSATAEVLDDRPFFNDPPSTVVAEGMTTKKAAWTLTASALVPVVNGAPVGSLVISVGPFGNKRTVTDTIDLYGGVGFDSWNLDDGTPVSGSWALPLTPSGDRDAYEAAFRASGAHLNNFQASFSWSFDHTEIVTSSYTYQDTVRLQAFRLKKKIWTQQGASILLTSLGDPGGKTALFTISFGTDPVGVTGSLT